ncbi:hypothetical protein QAD02_011723 [Eretmocerus hayati]|uniref:Uncharacterized protein n=1 Tax=Eretmocerus hayati TaxID=131215 RepID=A0ACC2NXT7_9HYME|nr:hypothetical protein QAD02_011723 [Eretmocerus hayati]
MLRSKRSKTLVSVAAHNIPKVKEKIKAKLPVLTPNDIRRYRIPYSDAIVAELQEADLHEVAERLKFLFDLDEEARQIAGPNTLIWNRPKLRNNHELIDILKELFIRIHRDEMEEKSEFLARMALSIEASGWDWWWIADTLYRNALWLAKELEPTDLSLISLLRFVYARFLIDKMEDAESALEYARLAQRDSRDRPWSVAKLLREEGHTGSLYRHSCKLLNRILVSLGRSSRDSSDSVDLSVGACKLAVKNACEAGDHELLAESQFELGKSELAAGNVEEAIGHFTTNLMILRQIGDIEGICNAHSNFVRIYKDLGNDDKVLEHLGEFKEIASTYQLNKKLGEVYYLTGEYYLARDNPKEATPNLERAFLLYNQVGAAEDANKARCLTGISKGQEMMDSYQNLITQSVKGDSTATLKICLWRDRGEPFDELPTSKESN